MQEESISRAIIIVQQGMTPSAKQALVDMAPKYILEQFLALIELILRHEIATIVTHLHDSLPYTPKAITLCFIVHSTAYMHRQ